MESSADNDRAMTDKPQRSTLRAQTLMSGVAVLIALTGLQKIVGFGRNLAFCRWLEPAELGRWELAFSFLMLAAPLAVAGLPGAFARYLEHFRQRGQLRGFIWRVTKWSSASALAAIVVLFAAPSAVAWFVFEDTEQLELARWIAGGLVAVILFNYLLELLESLRQPRLVTWMRFIHSVMFTVFSVSLLFAWRTSAASIVIGYAAAAVVASALGASRLYGVFGEYAEDAEDAAPTVAASMWSKILPAAGSIWCINLLFNLFDVADRWMIVHFAADGAEQGAALVGQYYSSRAVPMLFAGVVVTFGGMLLPYLSADWEAGLRQAASNRLRLALKVVAVAQTFAGAIVLAVAPWLFHGLLAGKYGIGLEALPWTLVYCGWFGLMTVAQNYLWCAERTRWISAAMIAGLVANVTLNCLLLPRLGLEGAVIATAVGNLIALALTIAFSHRHGMPVDRGLATAAALPVLPARRTRHRVHRAAGSVGRRAAARLVAE
ncbi:MAG: lipopolysaccharide biosynthesis protein [Pirellulaceae bacterium]|jgi:O-antigen/teichoic acid export membrane protein|nr:lipopolysaccharide biosynthesis protein [Pirellulaceae bacterium]